MLDQFFTIVCGSAAVLNSQHGSAPVQPAIQSQVKVRVRAAVCQDRSLELSDRMQRLIDEYICAHRLEEDLSQEELQKTYTQITQHLVHYCFLKEPKECLPLDSASLSSDQRLRVAYLRACDQQRDGTSCGGRSVCAAAALQSLLSAHSQDSGYVLDHGDQFAQKFRGYLQAVGPQAGLTYCRQERQKKEISALLRYEQQAIIDANSHLSATPPQYLDALLTLQPDYFIVYGANALLRKNEIWHALTLLAYATTPFIKAQVTTILRDLFKDTLPKMKEVLTPCAERLKGLGYPSDDMSCVRFCLGLVAPEERRKLRQLYQENSSYRQAMDALQRALKAQLATQQVKELKASQSDVLQSASRRIVARDQVLQERCEYMCYLEVALVKALALSAAPDPHFGDLLACLQDDLAGSANEDLEQVVKECLSLYRLIEKLIRRLEHGEALCEPLVDAEVPKQYAQEVAHVASHLGERQIDDEELKRDMSALKRIIGQLVDTHVSTLCATSPRNQQRGSSAHVQGSPERHKSPEMPLQLEYEPTQEIEHLCTLANDPDKKKELLVALKRHQHPRSDAIHQLASRSGRTDEACAEIADLSLLWGHPALRLPKQSFHVLSQRGKEPVFEAHDHGVASQSEHIGAIKRSLASPAAHNHYFICHELKGSTPHWILMALLVYAQRKMYMVVVDSLNAPWDAQKTRYAEFLAKHFLAS